MDNNTNNKSGMGFIGALQLALIILKFCNVIKWSWWLVLLPLWIELGVFLILLGLLWWGNR